MSGMQGHYYSENGRQYMVLGTEEEEASGYEMRMLEKNQPPCFLSVQIYQMNGAVTFQYDITGKKNLEEWAIKTGLKGEEVWRLMKALGKMKTVVEEYLLDLDSVLLQEKYVFSEGENIYFTYYPQKEGNFFRNIKHLWEFVLARLDHGDKEGVLAAYGFYHDILEEVFCPEKYDRQQAVVLQEQVMYTSEDIAEEIAEVEEETENAGLKHQLQVISGGGKVVAGAAVAMALIRDLNVFGLGSWILAAVAVLAAGVVAAAEWMLKNPMAFLSRLEEKTKSIKFSISKKDMESLEKQETEAAGGTTRTQMKADRGIAPEVGETMQRREEECFDDDQKTQLLSLSAQQEGKRLESAKGTGETLWLSHFPTTVGSASNCSLVIKKSGISRIHLILSAEADQVYVEDMHSTNGTRLNGRRIEPGQRMVLCVGDRLCLGEAEYEYKA